MEILRLTALALCILTASSAQAAVLRVSAEPPLSVERLADAIRSYVDGIEFDVAPVARSDRHDGGPTAPGVIEIFLRRHSATDDDVELVLLDGEETVLNRLPGAMRVQDLYRAAALKVHALLQRRMSVAAPLADSIGARGMAANSDNPERFMLDTGLALLVPSAGSVREGLRLAAGLRVGGRWHIVAGAYLEPHQSTRVNDIDVSAWELPFLLETGFDWHRGAWSGWLDLVGHAAVRRISAQAPDVVSNSDLALSPRVGGASGLGLAIGQGLRVEVRASLLAVMADRRYLVDGQVIWPAARALAVVELGLAWH